MGIPASQLFKTILRLPTALRRSMTSTATLNQRGDQRLLGRNLAGGRTRQFDQRGPLRLPYPQNPGRERWIAFRDWLRDQLSEFCP